MDTLHFGSDAVIWLGISILGYFLRDLIKTNREQHEENKKALKTQGDATTAALQQIADRIKSDDEILAVVNGKYVSRRETDLITKESDKTHDAILEKLETANEEIAILRNHWHEKVLESYNRAVELLTRISIRMERP
jgi:hypothetical protein